MPVSCILSSSSTFVHGVHSGNIILHFLKANIYGIFSNKGHYFYSPTKLKKLYFADTSPVCFQLQIYFLKIIQGMADLGKIFCKDTKI
jgi:hypothetical protein